MSENAMDTKRCRHKSSGITSRCKECRNAVRRQPADVIPAGFRRCSACHLILPAAREYFSPQKERADGFVSECRKCRRKRGELWRLEHPEEAKQSVKRYYDNNPEVYKEKGGRRRAKERLLAADFTNAHWQKSLEWWHGACAYCGHGPSLFDLHFVLQQEHHIPIKRGGGYTPANIIPACQNCNFSKSGKDPEQWIIQRFGKKKSNAILARIKAYFEWIANH